MKYILLIIFSVGTKASFVVVKPDYSHKKLFLKIVEVYPDSWETYKLVNHNTREMTLVCANNRVYDNNRLPFIEYQNFYNQRAGRFTFPSNKVCLELGKFIENTYSAVSEEKPFLISLSRRKMEVSKIVYPKVDPLEDFGDVKDLLPRERRILTQSSDINDISKIGIE